MSSDREECLILENVLRVWRFDDVSLDDVRGYHLVSYHSVVVSDGMFYTGKVILPWSGLIGVIDV